MEKKNENIIIDQLSKNYPFTAPDGYLDEIPARIMASIEEKSKPEKELFFIRFIKPSLGLVASFIIIFGLIYIPVRLISPLKIKTAQINSLIIDEEYLISYPLSDHAIFETIESSVADETFDNDQLEALLLASVTEYELIDLNN